jgi:hypothetical protein
MSTNQSTFMGFPAEIVNAIGGMSEPIARSSISIKSGYVRYEELEGLRIPGLCYLENSALSATEKQVLFEQLAYWPKLHELCPRLEEIGKLVPYLGGVKATVLGDSNFRYIHMDESGGPGEPGDALFYVLTVGRQELLSVDLIWSKDISKLPVVVSEKESRDHARWRDSLNNCRCGRHGYSHTHILMHKLTLSRLDVGLPGARSLDYRCEEPNCRFDKQYQHTHGILEVGHLDHKGKSTWRDDKSIGEPIRVEYCLWNPRFASSDDIELSFSLFDAVLGDNSLGSLVGNLRVGGDRLPESQTMDSWVEILLELAKNGRMSEAAKEEVLSRKPSWVNNRSILEHYLKQPDRCYLSLIAASDEAMELRPDKFCSVVRHISDDTGTLPTGKEVIGAIAPAIAEQLVGPMNLENHGQFFSKSQAIQEGMLKSKARFLFEEKPDCLHITVGTYTDCQCKGGELYCVDHGWTANYPLTAIATTGLRVGGMGTELGIDFNQFFEGNDADDSTVLPGPVNSGFRVTTPLNIRKQESSIRTRGPSQHNKTSHIPIPSPFEYQCHDSDEEENTGVSDRNTRQTSKEEDSDSQIGPADSSSNIGRYTPSELACKKRYMKQGTVMTVRKSRGGGVVEESRVLYELPAIPEVVAGFIRTESIASAEVLSHHQVRPINGLARPFRNNRLNFLMHLHTAIHSLKPQEGISMISTMKKLKGRKVGDPSLELLFQVIKVTFDFEEQVIKGNPHRLPYIEPGMVLTDDAIHRCFSLLYSQYQIEWFNEVKNLRVPRFTSDSHDHPQHTRSRRSSESSLSVGSHKARSVLGILSGSN